MPTALNFDLSNGLVILRLACALFFVPHIYFKIVGNPPPALQVFVNAGFKQPRLFMRLALLAEIVAMIGLFFGIYTQWAALLAAIVLIVAAGAIMSVNNGFRWLWNLGGMEFPIFWAISCIVVAMLHWQ